MRARSKKPFEQVNIAKERIKTLLGLAEQEFAKQPERSAHYVALARKISMRYNVRLSTDLKRKFCKNCNTLLKPGLTSQARIDSKNKAVVIKCLKCNKIYRYPYTKGKKR